MADSTGRPLVWIPEGSGVGWYIKWGFGALCCCIFTTMLVVPFVLLPMIWSHENCLVIGIVGTLSLYIVPLGIYFCLVLRENLKTCRGLFSLCTFFLSLFAAGCYVFVIVKLLDHMDECLLLPSNWQGALVGPTIMMGMMIFAGVMIGIASGIVISFVKKYINRNEEQYSYESLNIVPQ